MSITIEDYAIQQNCSVEEVLKMEKITLYEAELPMWLVELKNLKYLDVRNNLIKVLPPFLEELKSLEYLDLCYNLIEELPTCLKELKNLKHLNLSYNKINNLPEFLTELTHLTSLDISGTQISELPVFLIELEELESLKIRSICKESWQEFYSRTSVERLVLEEDGSLSIKDEAAFRVSSNEYENNYTLYEIPEFFKELKNLISLDVSDNPICEFPVHLKELKNLTYLDMANTKIRKIPKYLKEFTNLTYLNIAATQIREIPEFLKELKNLTHLNIAATQIREIPKFLKEMTNLSYLDINSIEIREIPEFLKEMTNLTFLNLARTEIREIPEFLKEMTNLTSLDISFTQIREIPDCLEELKNLTYLDMSLTLIREIPDCLRELKNLKYLNISSIRIKEIPDFLKELKNLTYLNISQTLISKIPDFLTELKYLKKLEMRYNQIIELSETKFKSSRLFELVLCGSKLNYIPKSIIELNLNFFNGTCPRFKNVVDIRDVKLIYQDISLFDQPREIIEEFYNAPLVHLNECKVIFIGEGSAGKTSIINRILGRGFCDCSSTCGIQINSWNIRINEENVNVRLWDFGGQQILHSMHKCFLTQRTVYVVVLNARQDAYIERTAHYYLSMINSFAPDCGIVIAINQIDENKNIMIDEKTLKSRYKNLYQIVKTSAKINEGITDTLVSRIKEAIVTYSSYYHLFNENWLKIKKELEEIDNPYIDGEQYKEICKKNHIEKQYLQEQLLGWFQDLGVTYYSKNKKELLRLADIKVLKPEWITNAISRLVTMAPKQTKLWTKREIFDIINKKEENDLNPHLLYDLDETSYLLSVMNQSNVQLAFNIDGYELIPSLLGVEQPEWYEEIIEKSHLHWAWENIYLPDSILHHLMIERGRDIDTQYLWRRGALFHCEYNECYAFVQLQNDNTSSILHLHVWSDSKDTEQEDDYLTVFRLEINKIFQDHNIDSKQQWIYFNIDGISNRISQDHIKSAMSHGLKDVLLYEINKLIPIEEIIGNDLNKKLLKEIREMEKEKDSRNVTYSYSNIGQLVTGENARAEADAIIIGGGNSVIISKEEQPTIEEKFEKLKSDNQDALNEILIAMQEAIDSKELIVKTHSEIEEILKVINLKSTLQEKWDKFMSYIKSSATFVAAITKNSIIADKIKNLLK